jgi:membrane associated rhomboid family serine protease
MLSCPRCGTALEGLRRAFWACRACGGRAALFPVLRDRVGRERWEPFQRAFASATVRSARPCPGCRNRMLAADAGGTPIDACRGCQLLWFDAGEAPEPEPGLPPRPERAAPAGAPSVKQSDLDLTSLFYVQRGFPVEIESSSFANVPLATAGLTLAVIVIGLLATGHPDWIARFGFLPTAPFRDAGVTLFTHFFLHAGALHLAGNAYFLLVFGDNVEEAAGPHGLLVVTFLGAAAGALAHALSHSAWPFPLVGASAGISALLAYYGLRFPHARIGWFFMNLPAWGFVVLWALWQLLVAGPSVLLRDGLHLWTEVSFSAHLGGAGVGVAFWAIQRRLAAPA